MYSPSQRHRGHREICIPNDGYFWLLNRLIHFQNNRLELLSSVSSVGSVRKNGYPFFANALCFVVELIFRSRQLVIKFPFVGQHGGCIDYF
jgi:hypothetical protein